MSRLSLQRIREKRTPTNEESALGLFHDEIEPQVRYAVACFNKKGYKTISSGFEGYKGAEYSAEYQAIEGNFLINAETKIKLANVGAEIITKPWWKWQMAERIGVASSSVPEEDKVLTTVRFRALNPDLQEIEAKWQQIAAVLPNKR